MKALSERMHGTAKNANEGVLSLNENILAAYADEVAQLEARILDEVKDDQAERSRCLVLEKEIAALKRENEGLRELFRPGDADSLLTKNGG